MKRYKAYITAVVAVVVLLGVIWYLEGGVPQQSEVVVGEWQEEQQATSQNSQKQNQQTSSRPGATNPAASTPTTQETSTESPPRITYDNTNETEIFVVLPRPGLIVTPGIIISGAARGNNWFFRGSFFAEVFAENGDMLASIQVPGKGNTQTSEMVQFSSMIVISPNYRGPATVVLRSDTPYGHPYPDRSVSIPVVVE